MAHLTILTAYPSHNRIVTPNLVTESKAISICRGPKKFGGHWGPASWIVGMVNHCKPA